MARDEHRMPVPPEHIPIPLWIEHEQFVDTVRDADDQEVNLWDSPEFFVHAANWIIPCREIVREVKELEDQDFVTFETISGIVSKASRLWAKMQEEAKGGDGETSV